MNATNLVLVVEDNSDDYLILERMLSNTAEFQLERSSSATDAKKKLSDKAYSLVLLDLTLPDSDGIETIALLKESTEVPVVVLTGRNDEGTALRAVQHGAQDYLVKDELNLTLLVKTMRYALERSKLVQELEESRLQTRREQELARQQMSYPSINSPVTANAFEQKPLSESNPELLKLVQADYSALLDNVMDQRAFKMKFDASDKLRKLAFSVGCHRATPRDIIEIHSRVIKTKTRSTSSKKSEIYSEEGRYLLIGLLGHLCAFYSAHCISPRLNAKSPVDNRTVEP